MSVSDNGRFDELVSRYLDVSLRESEERELLRYLSEEEFAGRFYEITRLDAEIAGLLAGSIPDEVMVELVRNDLTRGDNPPPVVDEVLRETKIVIPDTARPGRNARRFLALAAMLVGLLVAVYFFHDSTPFETGTVVAQASSLQGEVYSTGPLGQAAIEDGQSLKEGETIKTVGSDSRVVLTLTDGTQIKLMGNTSFGMKMESGKRRLLLTWGTLRATVAKQKENDPLIFATDNAQATVRGTELALVAGGQDTYLVVLTGAVALQRLSGGPEVMINAGHYGHVEAVGEYHAWPIQRLPPALFDQIVLGK